MKHIYCSADWHGNDAIANKIFNFLQPNDTLVFCGDAIDRGDSGGVEIAARLIRDPRCIYLKGNHENMAVAALRQYCENKDRWFLSPEWWKWVGNGGNKTFTSLKYHEEEIPSWINKFQSLPDEYTYINKNNQIIICNHNGFTPGRSTRVDKYWDCRHIVDPWPSEDIYKNTIIVHGHIPVQFFGAAKVYWDSEIKYATDDNKAGSVTQRVLTYCAGHKINLDLGTYWSGKAALLDLDTFEIIYFEDEEKI